MAVIAFSGLNISAIPHPEGIYRELFERVAGKRVNFFGDKLAAISKPSIVRDGLFWGLIFTWTEIDKRQRFIDTILLETPTEEKLSEIRIPENIGFNSQVFYYVFRIADHTLVFETKNADGKTLSSLNSEKLFRKLFNRQTLDSLQFELSRPDYVEVDLIVEAAALDNIFSMENIVSLEILVSVPNSDDNTKEADDIIDHLKKMKARSQTTKYRAANQKEGIEPDDKLWAEGRAALRHGYVRGEGRDGGQKVSRSSKEYPKRVAAYVDKDSSTLDTALQVCKGFDAGLSSLPPTD